MKRFLLICLFGLTVSLINAQKIYFVYLQTETGEPFFVRLNDKLYSSTESGYLILSRLKDSTYQFKLGFPGKTIDLDFSTSIKNKDHGYLIKNFGEKGWGLFDLQSLSIQLSSSNAKGTAQLDSSINSGVNAFTNLLSKATDDPSLKQSPVLVKEEQKKQEAVEAVVKEEKKPGITDAVIKDENKPELNKEPVDKPEEKKTEIVNTNEQKVPDSADKKTVLQKVDSYKKSQVTKVSGANTTEGFESVYIDQYQDGIMDTVRILIPGDKPAINQEESKPENKKEDKKFLDITSDTLQAVAKPRAEISKEENKKKWGLFNKNKANDKSSSESNKEAKKWWPFNKNKDGGTEIKKCKSIADNEDFLKLRRRMAARTNDDGMIDEAKKYFKEKCFTTEQIKNLSSMFLSNAGKYNFFDIAYDHVSDAENYSSLQGELKDEYYMNRFKARFSN